jgi:hypothetical protein
VGLDDTADVVAQHLAENLVLHRRVRSAAHMIPELRLYPSTS